MPTVEIPQLTLNPDGANFRMKVTFDVAFSAFERRLAELGLEFRERIAVIGVDPPGATTGDVLFTVVRQIPMPSGVGAITIHRIFDNQFFRRSDLDEDSNPFVGPDIDADEIRVRIRIQTVGFPPPSTPDVFTNQRVIGGDVFTNQRVIGGIVSQPSGDAEA